MILAEPVDSVFPPNAKPNPVGGAGAGDEAAEFPNEKVGLVALLMPDDAGAEADANENREGAGALVEGGKSGLLGAFDAPVEGVVDPAKLKVGVVLLVGVAAFSLVVEIVAEDFFEPFKLL